MNLSSALGLTEVAAVWLTNVLTCANGRLAAARIKAPITLAVHCSIPPG